ncbi:hypothetical protein EDB19DRAFT_1829479 [Suillus lakei]|nr:hypothetical protein EDB19DRAFT_1829479 [Suillus lakei]
MSSPSDPPEIPKFKATFIIHLDTYTKITTESNGKAKTKEVKSTKVKELVFQISEPNYIEFLTTILVKHDKSHYRVTERKKYSFNCAEAMDVDNQADYVEMAKKLIFEEPQKIAGDTASQDSGASDDDKVAIIDSATELERKIACFCRLIIKKWGNEYDNSVTYIHQSGMEIPCTPAMIKDWACGMYNGEATTMVPPNIPSFDPAKREAPLHPMRCSMAAAAATPAATSYPKDHLGVAFASTYEPSLCGIGAGPDILADTADQDLA